MSFEIFDDDHDDDNHSLDLWADEQEQPLSRGASQTLNLSADDSAATIEYGGSISHDEDEMMVSANHQSSIDFVIDGPLHTNYENTTDTGSTKRTSSHDTKNTGTKALTPEVQQDHGHLKKEDFSSSRSRVVRFLDDDDDGAPAGSSSHNSTTSISLNHQQEDSMHTPPPLFYESTASSSFDKMHNSSSSSSLTSSFRRSTRQYSAAAGSTVVSQQTTSSIPQPPPSQQKETLDIFDEGIDYSAEETPTSSNNSSSSLSFLSLQDKMFLQEMDDEDDDSFAESIDSEAEKEKEVRRKIAFAVIGVGAMALIGMSFKKAMSFFQKSKSEDDAVDLGAEAAGEVADDAAAASFQLGTDAAAQASFNASMSQSSTNFAAAAGAGANPGGAGAQ